MCFSYFSTLLLFVSHASLKPHEIIQISQEREQENQNYNYSRCKQGSLIIPQHPSLNNTNTLRNPRHPFLTTRPNPSSRSRQHRLRPTLQPSNLVKIPHPAQHLSTLRSLHFSPFTSLASHHLYYHRCNNIPWSGISGRYFTSSSRGRGHSKGNPSA